MLLSPLAEEYGCTCSACVLTRLPALVRGGEVGLTATGVSTTVVAGSGVRSAGVLAYWGEGVGSSTQLSTQLLTLTAFSSVTVGIGPTALGSRDPCDSSVSVQQTNMYKSGAHTQAGAGGTSGHNGGCYSIVYLNGIEHLTTYGSAENKPPPD